jgi:hypothetical protein
MFNQCWISHWQVNSSFSCIHDILDQIIPNMWFTTGIIHAAGGTFKAEKLE